MRINFENQLKNAEKDYKKNKKKEEKRKRKRVTQQERIELSRWKKLKQLSCEYKVTMSKLLDEIIDFYLNSKRK